MEEERNGSYWQTPVVYRGIIHASTNAGVLRAYDARSGKNLYEQRLGDGKTAFTSSPAAANGKAVLSTTAISNKVIYLRTRHHLVAIGD